MHSRVQKWGNSLAVRIPKPFALEVGLAQDADVEITVDDGNVVISPRPGRSYRLADLLASVTKRNLHSEVDSGPSVGRESW
jgi:mRNA interferase MazF